jgi:hypothetical protein
VEKLLLSAVECTGVGGIRQTEIHTAEPFVPDTSEAEVATGKLKRYNVCYFCTVTRLQKRSSVMSFSASVSLQFLSSSCDTVNVQLLSFSSSPWSSVS